MATFKANTGSDPARTPRLNGTITKKATFTVPTGFTQATDDIDLFTIPAGATLVDMWASNVGTGQTLDVGDAADDDRFIVAAPAATTITRASLAAGLNFAFTADTVIKAVFNTANPTPTGVITVCCSYILAP